jgi:uncharacterized delta-60 repeat protein
MVIKRSIIVFGFIAALMITPAKAQVSGDLDSDADVDRADQKLLRSSLGNCAGDESFIAATDYNGTGCTDLDDYRIWVGFYRDFNPPPPCDDCTGNSRSLLRPGALDIRFGADGKVVTDISGVTDPGGNGDDLKALVIQTDGKIVAAGSSYTGVANITDFAVARYNVDGTLDTTFGSGGKVLTDFGGQDSLAAAAVQSDGKIVVAGSSFVGCCGDFVLARYDTDGTLDATFGTNGKVITDIGGNDFIAGMTILSNGKLLVVGKGGSARAVVLARYAADGSLDATFGTGGTVIDPTVPMTFVRGLSVLPDSKIVVVGTSFNDFALARYNADGTLDTTFGSGGLVTTDFGGTNDSGEAIAIASDGKIVLSGWSLMPSTVTFALARYNTDGTLDTTFGSDGTVTNDFGGPGLLSSSRAVAIQPDGKILAAGSVGDDFALARYNADGTLDTAFGSGGLVTTDFDNNDEFARALSIQSDGKIVLGGPSNADFALARYRY